MPLALIGELAAAVPALSKRETDPPVLARGHDQRARTGVALVRFTVSSDETFTAKSARAAVMV